MNTVAKTGKCYQEPRIIELGNAVEMTLSFGGSIIRDRRRRFPLPF